MWEDYILVVDKERDKGFFIRNLIAFYPDEGFMIFEGYTRIQKTDLPYEYELMRVQPNTDYRCFYNISMTSFSKKDVQDTRPPSKGHENCDPCECECRISFFPSDIIIMRFNVLKAENNIPRVNWNFCVDDRFGGDPAKLLERYMSLVELPEDQWEAYDINPEDRDFYVGYHEMLDKYQDIYRGVYDFPKKPKREEANLMILDILRIWKERLGVCSKPVSNTYGNKQKLADTLEFFHFLERHHEFFQKWCADFWFNESLEDKLRGWLTYGVRSVHGNNNPVDFEKGWKLFFRLEDDAVDIINLAGKEYDISYKHYVTLNKMREQERVGQRCADPEILKIHEGKECDHDLCCFLCEDVWKKWEQLVDSRYESMNNIFINRELGNAFVEAWLDEVRKMSAKEKDRINYTWPPFRTTSNFDETINNLGKQREQRYYTYRIRPKVEFEFMEDLNSSLKDYTVIPDLQKSKNQMNEVFLFLSKLTPTLSYLLEMDKHRCEELIEIFKGLADD